MEREAYVGVLQNGTVPIKTIVVAESEKEAREKVLGKFTGSFRLDCTEKDIFVGLFFKNGAQTI